MFISKANLFFNNIEKYTTGESKQNKTLHGNNLHSLKVNKDDD